MDSVEKLVRIREIAMTVNEPKNAGEIAEVADVSRNTTHVDGRKLRLQPS